MTDTADQPPIHDAAEAADPRPGLEEYAAAAREESGLTCAGCGCQHFTVKNTWRTADGSIRRLRICRHCGRPLNTTERANDGNLPRAD